MKTRLQSLWDEVSPEGGPCPQPDRKAVRRRVDAALDQKPRVLHPWRAVRLATICAAALLLLTGTAVATGMLPLPEHNVLRAFFGRGENAPGAEGLVNAQPTSVSDENYTLTVTSSISDGSVFYLTVLLQGKTPQAAAYLQEPGFSSDLLGLWAAPLDSAGNIVRWGMCCAACDYWNYDPDSSTWSVNVRGNNPGGADCMVSLRCSKMEEGLRLTFPTQAIPTIVLDIGREGPGLDPYAFNPYGFEDSIAGSVTLNRITLSPLSLRAEFTSPDESPPIPLLHFLWKDGSVSPARQLGIRGGASGYRHVGAGELWQLDETWTLNSVQDLSQMEAVVFGGLAYPLDGGAPYAVDVDALPQHELAP